jgi:hypothetical protein
MDCIKVIVRDEHRWHPNERVPFQFFVSINTANGSVLSTKKDCCWPVHLTMSSLLSEQQQQQQESPVDLDYLISKPVCVMLFNAALVIQTLALKSYNETGELNHRSRQQLQVACNLYTRSNELQLVHELCIESPMFSLSVFNNCGRCYELLKDEKNASECFQVLLQGLLLLQQVTDQYEDRESLVVRSCPSFHRNTSHLILKHNGNAPAA